MGVAANFGYSLSHRVQGELLLFNLQISIDWNPCARHFIENCVQVFVVSYALYAKACPELCDVVKLDVV